MKTRVENGVAMIATITAILLLIQQSMRLALVDVLVILSPLAAVLWILPQSHAWSKGVDHGGLWPSKLVSAKYHCVEGA